MFDTNLTRRPKGSPIWVRALPIVGVVAFVLIGIGVLAVKGERALVRHEVGEARNEKVAVAQMKSAFDSLAASKKRINSEHLPSSELETGFQLEHPTTPGSKLSQR